MLPRLAAALAEFLRQNATSRIRKVACKRRLRHWATECFFTLSYYCELNFIERYWCRVKWFMRENCEFDFGALKTGALESLASDAMLPSMASTDWHCAQLMLILQVFNMEPRNLSRRCINRIGR